MSTVKLGDLARDKITGFTGIVTGTSKFLNGCERCGITSRERKDGKPLDTEWFDVQQLEVVEAGAFYKEVTVEQKPASVGGPRPDPQRGKDAPSF